MSTALQTAPRSSIVNRTTKETDIRLALTLDGRGGTEIDTGIPFLDHLLDALARHGRMDLEVRARGDLQVDCHHTAEDVMQVLGEAFLQSLGERRGIERAGDALMAMDETLAYAAVDFSGRGFAVCRYRPKRETIGGLALEMLPDLCWALARGARAAVHMGIQYGGNDHHQCEAMFKALGRALNRAVSVLDRNLLMSTKGVIE